MLRALKITQGFLTAAIGILFIGSYAANAAAATEGQLCGTNPPNTGASTAEAQAVSAQATTLSIAPTVYTCQNTSSFTTAQRNARCVNGLCEGARSLRCCAPPETTPTVPSPTEPAAASASDTCGTSGDAAKDRAVQNIATANNTTPENFSCQNASNLSDTDKSNKCVSDLCEGGANTMCCISGVGTAPTAGSGDTEPTGPGTTGQAGGIGRLALPSCVSDGNCDLDDLVTMGVNFSNFLFGISGAIFLLVFVVSGFRLIFFASDAGSIKDAKNSLVKAATGMIIIALAGILTTFVYNNLRSGSNSGTEARGSTCEEEVNGRASGFTCQAISGVPSKEEYAQYEAALRSLNCRPSSRDTSNLCLVIPHIVVRLESQTFILPSNNL